MGNFSPERYKDWTNANIHKTIMGLQDLLREKSHTKILTHHIFSGNGIGTITSKVVAHTTEQGSCTTLEIDISSVGCVNSDGDIGNVGSKLTLTLDAKQMRDLSEFLSRIAWRMKDSEPKVKQPS